MKRINTAQIERLFKLMVTYQVSSLEVEGVKIVKTRFPEPSLSPTIPAQATQSTKPQTKKTAEILRDRELDRRAKEDKKLFYPEI